MIRDDVKGLQFEDGIYKIDTRFFTIIKCSVFPKRLFILDSDPLTYIELLEFLSIVKDREKLATSWCSEISNGFWPLKYIYVIQSEKDKYYILNRYYHKIDWKNFLTV